LYAIIQKKSRQTVVREGEVVQIDLDQELEPGQKVTFDEVLLVGHEGNIKVGKPLLSGATVSGEVVGVSRGPKLVVFRFKRRKNHRKKRGHRQSYTQVKITSIQA
jgi:large subunit ribosomal protein L21